MKRQATALIFLQAADLLTTHAGLARLAQEANPIGHAILGHGFSGLVIAKALGTAAILGTCYYLSRSQPVQARVGLQVCCSLMVAVVGWNSWILLLHPPA